jgi:cold shock CspA family protein
MSKHRRIAVCQRCGMGFLVTPTHRDSVTRWGARVVVPQLCLRCFRKRGPLPKQRGRVKWFNRRKHYGFIVSERGDEIFFHQDQIYDQDVPGPREGQWARFHVRNAIKGPEALNVELLDQERGA